MVVQKIIQIIDLLSLSWAIQPQLKNRKIESGLLKVNQRTIGYAMKIKKKKMFKSKHLVFAHFSTKTGDFFGIDGKIPMFCHKYFLKSKM